ncbi:hypothetical protein [Butyrivibrio sp. NC3005]|uniref:hypothetical protein n=1 Tax=Butyrivibrio sp. NC3005 TaxID=1280685 RepID=UPI00040A00B5|nr:hypothetical protein [Butyrivibrio sp. NC3005]
MALAMDEEKNTAKEVKTRKKTKRTRELLEEADRQMEEIKTQKRDLAAQLQDLQKKAEELGDKYAVGIKVEHNMYGKGEIIRQDGKYIEVDFNGVVKKFVLPGAIADKHLSVEDENLLDYFMKSNDIHVNLLKTKMQLRSAEFAIERQTEYIEKLNEKA